MIDLGNINLGGGSTPGGGGGTKDYNTLNNKPSINGTTLEGDTTLVVMTPEEKEKVDGVVGKVTELEEELYAELFTETLVMARDNKDLETITETRDITYTSKEEIEFDGSVIEKTITVNRPCIVYGSLLCKNSEQMLPSYSLDYEIKVGENWINSKKPSAVKKSGDYEAAIFEVTDEMLASNGGLYIICIGARALKSPTVPIKQVVHTYFTIYYNRKQGLVSKVSELNQKIEILMADHTLEEILGEETTEEDVESKLNEILS